MYFSVSSLTHLTHFISSHPGRKRLLRCDGSWWWRQKNTPKSFIRWTIYVLKRRNLILGWIHYRTSRYVPFLQTLYQSWGSSVKVVIHKNVKCWHLHKPWSWTISSPPGSLRTWSCWDLLKGEPEGLALQYAFWVPCVYFIWFKVGIFLIVGSHITLLKHLLFLWLSTCSYIMFIEPDIILST